MDATIICGDALTELRKMESASVQCCVTSPPYFGLRDYGVSGQIGLEATPDEYVHKLVQVFGEVKRVLRDDGTLWLNLGDSYANSGGKSQAHRDTSGGFNAESGRGNQAYGQAGAIMRNSSIGNGIKAKDLLGIPWMVAFALRADGWYLRNDIIWHKPNVMPESVTDRCTKDHEYIFLLSKRDTYYFDGAAIREPFADKRNGSPGKYKHKLSEYNTPKGIHGKAVTGHGWECGDRKGRNKRTVWKVTRRNFQSAHFATFPPELITPCILAGAPVGGVVLDPFFGAGTVGVVAEKHGRKWLGIELNKEYCTLSQARVAHAII